MSPNRSRSITAWAAVVLWMGLIFFFSHQPASQSSSLSRTFAEALLRLAGRGSDPLAIDAFNGLLRVFAHGSVFFVLALLFGFALRTVGITRLVNAILTLTVCLLYAASDEWHQSFVPGRASELADFLTDGAGILLAVILQQVIWTLWRNRTALRVER